MGFWTDCRECGERIWMAKVTPAGEVYPRWLPFENERLVVCHLQFCGSPSIASTTGKKVTAAQPVPAQSEPPQAKELSLVETNTIARNNPEELILIVRDPEYSRCSKENAILSSELFCKPDEIARVVEAIRDDEGLMEFWEENRQG